MEISPGSWKVALDRQGQINDNDREDTTTHTRSLLLSLPEELIVHCLSYLSPIDLTNVSVTCRALAKSTATDLLWQSHVNSNLQSPISSLPSTVDSFKELYVAHNDHWFITRNPVWISDSEHYGKLIVSRFNQSTGAIEAHTLVAERGEYDPKPWSEDSTVTIHPFEPHVKLHTEVPVLRLGVESTTNDTASPSPNTNTALSTKSVRRKSALSEEILMDCASPHSPGLRTAFLLSCDLPQSAIFPGSAVWPPLSIPAPSRTRNLSGSDFTSRAHRPAKLTDVSQSTFRLRKWVEYHGRRGSSASQWDLERIAAAAGLNVFAALTGSVSRFGAERRGERVTTFGTISPEAYTPTKRKPWRGIYAGDYAGHGCEFLLVLQPDEGTEEPLPDGLNWLMEWLTGGRKGPSEERNGVAARTYTRMNEILMDLAVRDGFRRRGGDGDDDDQLIGADDDDVEMADPRVLEEHASRYNTAHQASDEDIYSGRLVAIKLTGDPHIPRGEISFIAPDLGDKGFVRTAEEDIFKGARIVRSAGHVANRGFIYDEYIPSQLILASNDCLAQYWQGFGHISFYRRVDLDGLMAA